MTDLTTVATEYPTKHAYRHDLGEIGRESLAHMLLMPEHGIAGFVYPTMRAGGGAKGRAGPPPLIGVAGCRSLRPFHKPARSSRSLG
ncbi:hypothetical protein ACN94_18875 [Gordonia paraffinivorans]|uniref:hypothetical protein n=1 Tax=Gordonia paraffinivorans TaxID=175628 RepID=UPI001C92BA6D|nr:hypothetical protein [Gordonia paraffinivorans]MBY4575622.1 hypothetical protein [Gordonia paraffinivorans]